MIGKGAMAEVIEYGKDKVCKLFYEDCSEEFIKLEYKNAIEMYKNNITIPKPFEIINLQNRKGIIYERIYGKTLSHFLNGDNKNKMLELFVDLHRNMLSHHSKNMLSYKEVIKKILNRSSNKNHDFIKQINMLPDGTNICHGDLHPKNIIIKSDGTAVIIDFTSACCGPFLCDIARTFFILNTDNNSFLANEYLEKMNVLKTDIKEYINVFEKLHKYEKLIGKANIKK